MGEQAMKDCQDAEELHSIFLSGEDGTHDKDAPKMISLEDFYSKMQHEKFRAYLQVRGIDIKNAEVFYNMLRTVSGDDEVDVKTLVSACLRMKGLATSIDLHSLSFETKLLSRKQAAFWRECSTRLTKIEEITARVLHCGIHHDLVNSALVASSG